MGLWAHGWTHDAPMGPWAPPPMGPWGSHGSAGPCPTPPSRPHACAHGAPMGPPSAHWICAGVNPEYKRYSKHGSASQETIQGPYDLGCNLGLQRWYPRWSLHIKPPDDNINPKSNENLTRANQRLKIGLAPHRAPSLAHMGPIRAQTWPTWANLEFRVDRNRPQLVQRWPNGVQMSPNVSPN
jgi:hypothetical protein